VKHVCEACLYNFAMSPLSQRNARFSDSQFPVAINSRALVSRFSSTVAGSAFKRARPAGRQNLRRRARTGTVRGIYRDKQSSQRIRRTASFVRNIRLTSITIINSRPPPSVPRKPLAMSLIMPIGLERLRLSSD